MHALARGGDDGVLLRQRSPDDAFEGRNKGAARRARNAAIPDPQEFDDDPTLAIILKWGRKELWQVRRRGEWRDMCDSTDRGT